MPQTRRTLVDRTRARTANDAFPSTPEAKRLRISEKENTGNVEPNEEKVSITRTVNKKKAEPKPTEIEEPKPKRSTRRRGKSEQSKAPKKATTTKEKKSTKKIALNKETESLPDVENESAWERKYKELFEMRETGPEKLYEEYKKSVEKRENAAEELIQKQKLENMELKEKLSAMSKVNTDDTSDPSSENDEIMGQLKRELEKVQQKAEEMQKKVEVLQRMTGCTLTAIEGASKFTYELHLQNAVYPEKEVRLEISLFGNNDGDPEEDEIEMSPIPCGTPGLLPEPMRNTICFPKAQFPIAFHNIFGGLYSSYKRNED